MMQIRVSCDQIFFLGIRKVITKEEIGRIPIEFWKECLERGSIQKLKEVCGTNKVYGLWYQESNGEEDRLCYALVCENTGGIFSEVFDEIKIKPSTYLIFEKTGEEAARMEEDYESMFEEIWKEYLPQSKYEALIEPLDAKFQDGYAILERFAEEEINSVPYWMEIWVPIKAS